MAEELAAEIWERIEDCAAAMEEELPRPVLTPGVARVLLPTVRMVTPEDRAVAVTIAVAGVLAPASRQLWISDGSPGNQVGVEPAANSDAIAEETAAVLPVRAGPMMEEGRAVRRTSAAELVLIPVHPSGNCASADADKARRVRAVYCISTVLNGW